MAVVKRRRGKKATVEDKRCPDELGYLWVTWNELHAARSSGMAPNPIGWREIEAYQRVTGEDLLPWEARVIRAVDNVYLEGVAGPPTQGGQ